MMRWLNTIVPLPENFTHDMFRAKSDFSGEKLHRAMDIETGVFTIAGKRLGIIQLEMVYSEILTKNRKNEMLDIMHIIQTQNNLDYIFVTMLDIEAKLNRFLCDDTAMQHILSQALTIIFIENLAVRQDVIMRKEISPLIKLIMEK